VTLSILQLALLFNDLHGLNVDLFLLLLTLLTIVVDLLLDDGT